MTRGTCALGQVNHFLGTGAYDDSRPSRYPNINFCRFPSVICNRVDAAAVAAGISAPIYPELRFIVALFDWIYRVQNYSNAESNWNYLERLKLFVDGGMKEDTRFIDEVSSLLVRGCEEYYCSTQSIHFLEERRRNFETLVFDIFNLQETVVPEQPPQLKYDLEHTMRWLHSKRSKIEGNIFVSQNQALDGVSYFSQAFKFEPFMSALRTTSYFGIRDQRYFFVSDETKGLRGFNAGNFLHIPVPTYHIFILLRSV